MNILYALSHINKSLQWQWFAEEMKNRGINQTYVIVDDGVGKSSYLHDDLLKMGITSYFLPYINKLAHVTNVLKTVSIIKKHKAEIVHTSLPYGNAVGQMAAWFAGIKNRVSTCENASWAHDFHNKKQENIDKLTYSLSKKVIAVADSAKEYLKDHYHISDDKLLTIYHGLKESEYDNVSAERVGKIKCQLQINENDFIVGVVSRYEFWKGHEFINKAAAILKQRNKDKNIKILVFGSKGSYYDTAMQQVKDLGVEDVVISKGYIDDPVALFRLFDVHLHVPVNKYVENCGINIIEGMISERPQILTKSGYAWQSAEHMKNAYVVDYENAEAIADAILYMKENYDRAKQLASQAHADAIKDYSLKVKADKHIALYNEMLK
jgi:glycosyltransferase involved in cell wall biosynthesis